MNRKLIIRFLGALMMIEAAAMVPALSEGLDVEEEPVPAAVIEAEPEVDDGELIAVSVWEEANLQARSNERGK